MLVRLTNKMGTTTNLEHFTTATEYVAEAIDLSVDFIAIAHNTVNYIYIVFFQLLY